MQARYPFYWLLSLMLLIGFFSISLIISSQEDVPDEPNIRIIREGNTYLAIQVISEEPAFLNGLNLQVNNVAFPLEESFTVLTDNVFSTIGLSEGQCLIYVLGEDSRQPNSCDDQPTSFTYLGENEVFWHVGDQPQDIVILGEGNIYIGLCTSGSLICEFSYNSPPPTEETQATSTESPTDTPTMPPPPTPTTPPLLTPEQVEQTPPSPTPTQTPVVDDNDGSVEITEIDHITRQGQINDIALHPDGDTLLTGHSNGMLCLWDVSDLSAGITQITCRDSGHGVVHAVAWQPSFQSISTFFASVGNDTVTRIWNFATNILSPTPIELFGHENGHINDVIWNGDGSLLATVGNDDRVFAWDTTTWDRVEDVPMEDPIAITWSVDSRNFVTISQNGVLRLGDITQGIKEYIGSHLGVGIDTDWNQAGNHLASIGEDQVVRLYNSFTNNLTCPNNNCDFVRLAQNIDGLTTVNFSPDGELLAVGANGAVHLYDTQSPNFLLHIFENPDSQITAIDWDPEIEYLYGADDTGTLYAWYVDTSTLLARPSTRIQQVSETPLITNEFGSIPYDIAWNRGGEQIVVVDAQSNLSIWDVNEQENLLIQPLENQPRSVAWSTTRNLIATGTCGPNVVLWDISEIEEPRIRETLVNGLRECITALAFDNNGSLIALGDEAGLIRIWDWQSNTQFPQLNMNNAITDLRWNGEQLSATSVTGQVIVWGKDANRMVEVFCRQPAPSVPLNALAWEASGEYLATGSVEGWISVWNVNGIPEECPGQYGFEDGYLLEANQSEIISLSWNANANQANQLISLDTNSNLFIWDGYTGERLARATLNGTPIIVRWSLDGSRFAIVRNNGNITFWTFSMN